MTLSIQFQTLLMMIVSGIAFGAILDTYNYFLNRKDRKRWLVFVHDIIFWILQGLLIFYILYRVNNGEIRFYIFVALLCGFSAYQALFKSMYMKLLFFIVRIVKWFIQCVLRIITIFLIRPSQFIFRLTISFLRMLKKGLLALLNIIYKILKWLIRLGLTPVVWIFKIIWKILPKHLKINVVKYYNNLAGFMIKFKNLCIHNYNKFKMWKNKNDE